LECTWSIEFRPAGYGLCDLGLHPSLLFRGISRAEDTQSQVSRKGGFTQTNAMKKVDSERASERKRNRETQKDRKGKRENDAPQIETAKCTCTSDFLY
jgi:F0F1-type ATP synthase alpha subunit